jgi:hypothetical protein
MWTLNDINNTRIQPEEITYLVTEMGRLRHSGEKPDFAWATFLLFRRYKEMPDPDQLRATKTFCIMERMQCLSHLATDERMRGWTADCPGEEWVLANEAIFHAAALCPVKEKNGRAYFDADEFFALVLKESPAEGNA